ncbi:MAG: HAMP domain-containing sensor histidine kinase [Thermoanaerobaculia bacterium]|nr:HAMP domain-containing sensor histidine kinase [Thermoanaerobaculia bacterium]
MDRLDPSVRPLADRFADLLEGDDEAEFDRAILERCNATPEQLWEVIAAFQRSLARSQSAASPDEFTTASDHLECIAGRLWSLAAREEARAVREFLVEVAHDFRSPLHSSLFLTKSLFEQEDDPLTDSQERRLRVVHTAVSALLRLTNDLLDFSEPDEEFAPDGVAETPFSTERVVDELEDLLTPIIHHRRADFERVLEDSNARVGDPQLMKRVLLNLLSNAVEAAGDEGRVRLRLEGDVRQLRAHVANDSVDVDPEQLRDLIRGGDYASVVRRLGGQTRGLGLVISGRLIRVAGGGVKVECTSDGWTQISVTFPFPTLQADS